MAATKIPWATHVWNPATGCSPISEGCKFCYAAALAPRLAKMGQEAYAGEQPFAVRTHPELDSEPILWRRPRRVFVGSMTDLFHEEIPDGFLIDVFRTMLKTPRHTYLLLTKRPARLVEFWSRIENRPAWPSHVWAGFTAETQRRFDERWTEMRRLAAFGVRNFFVSIEPMLEAIQLDRYEWPEPAAKATGIIGALPDPSEVDDWKFWAKEEGAIRWVICGGESAGSPDRRLVDRCTCYETGGRRPYCEECHHTGWRPKPWALQAVRSLRDQCAAGGIPFFFKQWGGPTPKASGDQLDGCTYHEIPEGMVA